MLLAPALRLQGTHSASKILLRESHIPDSSSATDWRGPVVVANSDASDYLDNQMLLTLFYIVSTGERRVVTVWTVIHMYEHDGIGELRDIGEL